MKELMIIGLIFFILKKAFDLYAKKDEQLQEARQKALDTEIILLQNEIHFAEKKAEFYLAYSEKIAQYGYEAGKGRGYFDVFGGVQLNTNTPPLPQNAYANATLALETHEKGDAARWGRGHHRGGDFLYAEGYPRGEFAEINGMEFAVIKHLGGEMVFAVNTADAMRMDRLLSTSCTVYEPNKNGQLVPSERARAYLCQNIKCGNVKISHKKDTRFCCDTCRSKAHNS